MTPTLERQGSQRAQAGPFADDARPRTTSRAVFLTWLAVPADAAADDLAGLALTGVEDAAMYRAAYLAAVYELRTVNTCCDRIAARHVGVIEQLRELRARSLSS